MLRATANKWALSDEIQHDGPITEVDAPVNDERTTPMHATKTLPPTYSSTYVVDLSRDRRLLIGLNIAGIFWLVIVVALLLWLFLRLRPEIAPIAFSFTAGSLLSAIVLTLFIIFVTVLLHEAIHGLFFWLFTKERPRFGFKGAYAYAAAPAWYLPRDQFLIVGLAPLLLITVVGLWLVPLVPKGALPLLFVALAMNSSGAIGDLYVTGLLLRRPRHTLINDVGDGFTFYEPQ